MLDDATTGERPAREAWTTMDGRREALEALERRCDGLLTANNALVDRVRAAERRALDAERELTRLRRAFAEEADDVEQALGKALGYPWYKDDPANFPDATEADGVCVGEHVPGSIAREAASRIGELHAAVLALLGALDPRASGAVPADVIEQARKAARRKA